MAAPSPLADPLIGRILANRYRIVARIGAGTMGGVYRAWDVPGDRYVVVKIPAERAREPAVFLARFAREMEVLRRIDHPHVVRIIDDGTCEGRPFAVMPYLAGGSLALRRPRRDGAIQPASATLLHRWLPDVAAALDHLHALGFVHRDVTPDTILFDGHGRALVGDFGLARVSEDLVPTDPSLADTGTSVGATEYVDPRVLQGGEPLPASDQFALAVIVYELLAGRLPLTGDSPTARMIAQVTEEPQRLRVARPDLPRSVGEAVHRGLAKGPDRRFSNCSEFAAAVLAEIAPPAKVTQRRLMCPACQMLIASDDRHGGKLGSCPQCKSPLWIAPDLLALVIPADPKPLPITPEDSPAPSNGRSVSAETLEPSPPLDTPSNSRLVAAVPRTLRSRLLIAGGVAIATAALGLGLVMLLPGSKDRASGPTGSGTLGEPPTAVDEVAIVAAPPVAGAAGDPPLLGGDHGSAGLSASAPRDEEGWVMPGDVGQATVSEPQRSLSVPASRLTAHVQGDGEEAVSSRRPEPSASEVTEPAVPPRIGVVNDPVSAVARELDLLFIEWDSSIRSIEKAEATINRLTPDFDRDQKLVNDVTSRIQAFVAEAEKRRVLADFARRANDAVTAEQRTVESLTLLQEAQSLRPELEEHQREVRKYQAEFARLNTEIAAKYKQVAMELPTWVDTLVPFDRNDRQAAILEEVDAARTKAERQFDGNWIHLEARVVQLHLTAATADAATVERATIALIDDIEKADAFLKARRVDDEARRRLLHYPRLHVGYATYRLLAATDRPPKKLDDWLQMQDERVSARMVGKALQGLHALAQRRFATAARHLDEFAKREPETLQVETIETPLPDGSVLSRGVYVPAVDDRLNTALHAEIAWFFAAAPAPLANPAKARKLLDKIRAESTPWQAIRAEAALMASENRWDDAVAALARAEQRAPLLMAREIHEQREAYENRRLYTLARTR